MRGILNPTTNLILGQMENGETFEDAVKCCQQIGMAETGTSGDVDGWDASNKVTDDDFGCCGIETAHKLSRHPVGSMTIGVKQRIIPEATVMVVTFPAISFINPYSIIFPG